MAKRYKAFTCSICRIGLVFMSIVMSTMALSSSSDAVDEYVPQPLGPLATDDQRTVEARALRLLDTPQVRKQREATYQYFLNDPIAKTLDGMATLKRHVDNLTFVQALGAANSDSARPKVVWYFAAAHEWMGLKVPSGRWGFDNPDNVYRFATIDGTSKYEVIVHPASTGAAQASAMIFDAYAGENTKQRSIWLDEPIAAVIFGDNLKREADGSFRITVDSEPPNGRLNHLQGNADSKILMFRESFSDWEHQSPARIEIRRVAGPKKLEPTEQEFAERAAYLLKSGTDFISRLNYNAFSVLPYNIINNPWLRGGRHGMSANGRFLLAEDEGLLVTLDPLGGKYLGFGIADPWTVTCEHVKANGTLNNTQAKPNKDGTYTFIIAAKDPGVWNWLDTEGLHEGTIMIRWQALPQKLQADKAVREVTLVKLSDLPRLLPPETTKVTPEQRKAIYAERAAAYRRRYGSEHPVY